MHTRNAHIDTSKRVVQQREVPEKELGDEKKNHIRAREIKTQCIIQDADHLHLRIAVEHLYLPRQYCGMNKYNTLRMIYSKRFSV